MVDKVQRIDYYIIRVVRTTWSIICIRRAL